MTAVSYLFGGVGILVNALIYQQEKGRRLLWYKFVSDLLWSLHYLLLGAWAGAAVAAVNLFRELFFLRQLRTGKENKGVLLLFLFLGEALTAATALLSDDPLRKWAGILVALAVLLSTYAFWKSVPRLSRVLALPISACMMTYDVLVSSPIGILNEILTVVSSLYGIFRCKERKTKNE